jgi:hypothetical protein
MRVRQPRSGSRSGSLLTSAGGPGLVVSVVVAVVAAAVVTLTGSHDAPDAPAGRPPSEPVAATSAGTTAHPLPLSPAAQPLPPSPTAGASPPSSPVPPTGSARTP